MTRFLRLSDALSGSRLWVKTDYNSKRQVNWRREAREDFDLGPANSSRRKIRRSRNAVGIADVGKGSWCFRFWPQAVWKLRRRTCA